METTLTGDVNCSCRALRDLQAAAGNSGEKKAVPVTSVILLSRTSLRQALTEALPSDLHMAGGQTASGQTAARAS